MRHSFSFVQADQQLPFPSLMRDARRAVSLGDLDPSKRSCINGWIKALFGPDGIDDEIILATTPAEFYRLAAGVIQQSILATAAGQIDIDTLHSGLSYFSQPLLSWSLGGIVEWLADEIIRYGLVGLVLSCTPKLTAKTHLSTASRSASNAHY